MRTGSIALGAVLAALGAIWLLEVTDVVDLDTGVWVGAFLIAVGIAVIASPPGGARALLVVIGILLALVGGTFAVSNVDLSGGIGEDRESPDTPEELEDPYELGIGSLKLDLSGLELEEDTTVRAQIGIGELWVRVPVDTPVSLDAELGIGDVNFLGEHESGVGPDVEASDDGGGTGPELRLELEGGIGEIRVERGFGFGF